MAKIPNDKYYTPADIVEHCVNNVKEIVITLQLMYYNINKQRRNYYGYVHRNLR